MTIHHEVSVRLSEAATAAQAHHLLSAQGLAAVSASEPSQTTLWLQRSLPTVQRMATDEVFRREVSRRLS